MTEEVIKVAATIFAIIYGLSTIGYVFFRKYMKVREEELKLERAKLDDFRAHLEKQLYQLNVKFSTSDDRWRELNHLVVAGQRSNFDSSYEKPSELQLSGFLKSHGLSPRDLKTINDQIFVLTPFHDDFVDEFMAVMSVGQRLGLSVYRGDEKVSPGDIFPHLLRYIVQSRFIIANITGRNPNVFYELGIAHALDKPVILLANKNSEVPFDIKSKTIIFYNDLEDLRLQLSMAITKIFVSSL